MSKFFALGRGVSSFFCHAKWEGEGERERVGEGLRGE